MKIKSLIGAFGHVFNPHRITQSERHDFRQAFLSICSFMFFLDSFDLVSLSLLNKILDFGACIQVSFSKLKESLLKFLLIFMTGWPIIKIQSSKRLGFPCGGRQETDGGTYGFICERICTCNHRVPPFLSLYLKSVLRFSCVALCYFFYSINFLTKSQYYYRFYF